MSARERITDWSKGDGLRLYWRLFRRREKCRSRFMNKLLTLILNRMAHRHGGYIGNGAKIHEIPSLPHGIHGVFISRFAEIGAGCRIYQNVTIGEVELKAPVIGKNCLIGAGAAIIGNIKIGNNVKIGANAVVFTDIPDNSTVVAPAPRVFERGTGTNV